MVVVKSFMILSPSLFLNEFLQTVECFVPSLRDVLQIGPRRFHLSRFEFPDTLSAAPHIRDEPSGGEYVQVLGDGLPCDSRPGGQPRYRERAVGAQPVHQLEPGFVTERRKDRRGARSLARGGATSRHIARCSRAAP